jgi:hypothetical protein
MKFCQVRKPLCNDLLSQKFNSNFFILYKNKIGYVTHRNTEARSNNHCCSGKSVSVTYSVCVFVAFCMQHTMHDILRSILARCSMYGVEEKCR